MSQSQSVSLDASKQWNWVFECRASVTYVYVFGFTHCRINTQHCFIIIDTHIICIATHSYSIYGWCWLLIFGFRSKSQYRHVSKSIQTRFKLPTSQLIMNILFDNKRSKLSSKRLPIASNMFCGRHMHSIRTIIRMLHDMLRECVNCKVINIDYI